MRWNGGGGGGADGGREGGGEEKGIRIEISQHVSGATFRTNSNISEQVSK